MGPQEEEDRDATDPGGFRCSREPGYKMAWRELLGVSGPESRAMARARQGSAPGVMLVLQE